MHDNIQGIGAAAGTLCVDGTFGVLFLHPDVCYPDASVPCIKLAFEVH